MGSSHSKNRRTMEVTGKSKPAPAKAVENQAAGEGAADSEDGQYVEAVVGKASEFGDNEMREVDIGDSKALVVKQNGELSAIGHKCTHYGAPLVNGYLGNGRVRCPWHGACFNIKSGDIEEFPGLDSVPCFQVRVEDENIVVKADKASLAIFRRTAGVCPTSHEEDPRTFLIVGGGPASVECAETLRKEKFKGRIIIASRESELPYDRPKLSKALDLPATSIALRPRDFYSAHGIDLLLGKEMTSLDLSGKKVVFSDGQSQDYDTLLLATGSRPRTLPIPGFNLENVFLLREPEQSNKIAESAAGKNVVVIGTSFIGMEVTAYLSDKAASVSCIDVTAVPFERVLGSRVGKMLQSMHEENGVKFYLSAGIKEIVGEVGKVTGVILPSGERLEADVVVAGVGVVPATHFLKDSGLPMSAVGEVLVDKYLKATDSVFAAGDIVRFPLPLIDGNTTNIGHWQIAHNHGRTAARNMLGKEEPFNSIPYFWTMQFGKSLRYCGHALSWDEIIFNGSPEDRKFVAYYVKNDKVMAVSSLNFDPTVSQCAELMYQNRMPTGTQLRANPDVNAHL